MSYTIKIKLTAEEMKKIILSHLMLEGQIDQRVVSDCDIEFGKDGKKYTVEISTPIILPTEAKIKNNTNEKSQ